MGKPNTLYYIAAGGAVVLLVTAAIGLSSFGAGEAAAASQQEALRNAYEQGYLDGYAMRYQEEYNAAAAARVEQSRTMYTTPTRTGCAPSSCDVPDSRAEDEDEQVGDDMSE
ncbi:MAG: hypothetical protein M0R22_02645 [Dehalococcoidia bacterium]|jgi:hypothetical protein|nr:hypothetical protein [Dehalococcoidia bacterium]